LRLVACEACGLVYSSPQPRAAVRERYLRDYDLAEHFDEWSTRKKVLFERRLASLPQPAPGRDRLIDVGCADGQFLELAAAAGWRADGIELNPPAAERARERGGGTVLQGDVQEMNDLPWASYEVVTCWDVLEHVPEPRPFAERLRRLARPGGRVALTTLNNRSLVSRAFRTNWSMVGEDHFTYWDEKSLTSMLEGVGLEVTGVDSFGLGRDFFRWADRLQRRLRRRAGEAAPAPSIHKQGLGGTGWDTSGVVLRGEHVVNRALGATGTGVDLFVAARRPEGDPA
jgi:SAM-dependent methyltransferase